VAGEEEIKTINPAFSLPLGGTGWGPRREVARKPARASTIVIYIIIIKVIFSISLGALL
jgi:hypothetical protein